MWRGTHPQGCKAPKLSELFAPRTSFVPPPLHIFFTPARIFVAALFRQALQYGDCKYAASTSKSCDAPSPLSRSHCANSPHTSCARPRRSASRCPPASVFLCCSEYPTYPTTQASSAKPTKCTLRTSLETQVPTRNCELPDTPRPNSQLPSPKSQSPDTNGQHPCK